MGTYLIDNGRIVGRKPLKKRAPQWKARWFRQTGSDKRHNALSFKLHMKPVEPIKAAEPLKELLRSFFCRDLLIVYPVKKMHLIVIWGHRL